MGLFGFCKKKKQKPVVSHVVPEQPPVPPDVKPYQYMYMHDGQWFINPNYDPKAPKPEQLRVIGLDPDDDEEESDDNIDEEEK